MYPRKKWIPIAVILYLVQFVFEVIALVEIMLTNMLPDNMVLVIALVFVLMLIITGMMLFRGMWRKPSTARRVRRVVAVVLAAVMAAGSLWVTHLATRLNETVNSITADNTGDQQIAAYVGVYVMSSDKAESINDLTSASFGIMENFDQSNTQYAVNYINDQTGTKITTSDFPSMVELAQALYDGKTETIIMNEAYAGALTGFDQFVNFDTDTREILQIPVIVSGNGDDSNNLVSSSASSQEIMDAIDKAASKSDITKTPFIMYLSGSDTREQMLVTSRSDVNLLMVVNPSTHQILLLNTPRDYYVENPAGNYAYDKLTHCGIYGIDNSEKTLENLYDLKVNYYMQINFTGFENLVDAIGGITVYSPVAFSANDIDGSGYEFVEGENKLNGDQALKFARERHAFASGDNARGENQMRVITAIIDKVTSNGATVLLNYDKIMSSIEGMFMTDLSDSDIAALVKMQLTDQPKWNIKSYAVTGEGGSEYTYSAPSSTAYVMYQDKDMVDTASKLVKKVMNGEELTDEDLTTSSSSDSSSSSSDEGTTYSDESSDNSYSQYSTGSTYSSGNNSSTYNSGYNSSTYNSGYNSSTYDSGNYSSGDYYSDNTYGDDSSGYNSTGYDSSGYDNSYGDTSTTDNTGYDNTDASYQGGGTTY